MKVLYLTNLSSPYRVDFFNLLSKYCDLTVLFERKIAGNRNDEWYNNTFDFNGIFLKSRNIGNEASISFEVIKYLKQKYDLIILGGYSTPTAMIASMYMKVHKISYVLNADGGFINYDEGKVIKFIKTFFISSAKYWLSSGKETNKYLIYYGAKKNRIYDYPFTSLKAIDILNEPVLKTEKEKLKREFGVPYNKVMLSIGQFIPRKGFDWMIESYRDLNRDIGIYIIGGKPTKEYLNLKRKYKMDNLHFIDFQDKEVIKKWYQLADIFVLPTREDIWGLVVNEAMAQGLPVITTDKCIAGLELIDNGENGYIVKCEIEKELFNITNKIINVNEIQYEKLSISAIQSIKNSTIENMVEKHLFIINDIIDQNKTEEV
ncbi:glycosyltransferase family 4 protein [Thomasclavelia cocleata]|uniref:glycosyltransferase family 4 protein n=1 Tax=Thomasclavelia cocleata TaxID=69824 RepID=UPI00242ACA45|nr:glycosyltransferase family 4 protein [Thomasclavelia cocleata]